MDKRGQTAIEFLMTYGWAILVVMIAIASLTYFGVLNPSRSLPERCLFGNNINCQDSLISISGGNGALNVSILNGLGMTLYDLSAVPDGFVGACTVSSTILSPDSVASIDCSVTSPSLILNEKSKLKLKLNFKKTPIGYNQVSLGEIYATVQ
jgi:hypothetical protein